MGADDEITGASFTAVTVIVASGVSAKSLGYQAGGSDVRKSLSERGWVQRLSRWDLIVSVVAIVALAALGVYSLSCGTPSG